MTSNHRVEEQKLSNIFDRHVKPVSDEVKVKLTIYYKTKRLSNLFIKNKMVVNEDPSSQNHVVYQYSCNRAGCSSSTYIGYTTCSLWERFRMHTQNGSIIRHLSEAHGVSRIPRREFLEDTKVLRR